MTFKGLEGVRGLMCLWVILSHTVTMAGIHVYKNTGIGKLVANGGIAVDVFVILSGFVICLILNKKKEAYAPYLARRALRIFPIYLLCLFISFFISDLSIMALESLDFDHPKTERRLEIFDNFNKAPILHTVLHTFLLHGLIPNSLLTDTAYTLMGQAWSLTLEFQFYIVAPMLFYILSSSKLKFVFAIALLIVCEGYMRSIMGHKSFFFAYSHYFIVGMLSYSLYATYIEDKRDHRAFLLLTSTLFIFTFLMFGYRNGLLSVAGLLIWALVFYVEYYADRQSVIGKPIVLIIRSRPVIYLGKISYSMYCSHMIFLYLCAFLFSTEGYFTQINDSSFTILMLIVPFCLTLLFSSISFKFIEKPFISLGKRLFLEKS